MTELRIEQILGRELLGGNHQPVGRIEEFRAHVSSNGCQVRAVVIGTLGLLERLDLGARLVVGAALDQKRKRRVARFDQIDFSNPSKPTLLVTVDTLDEL